MGKNREKRLKRERKRESERERERERERESSEESKLAAVRLATSGERSLAQVARDLEIHANHLSSWKCKALASFSLAHVVFPGNGNVTSQAEEIRRLKREVAIAREERDFLRNDLGAYAPPVEPETSGAYYPGPSEMAVCLVVLPSP